MSNKVVLTAVIAVILGGAGGYYSARWMGCATGGCQGTLNESQCALRRGMEKLWSDHVWWTRQFIVSSIAGLPDAGIAAERLFKNQDDIGAAIVPYYGAQAGAQLAKLLREHISIAADIVKAAMAKDDAKVKELDATWHNNAQEIATFLSSANPNWPAQALTDMLYEHLKLTTQEVVDRLTANWTDDVANFDKIFEQARMMGKDLADGIIKQFPDKF
jgi:hypothetical protein